MTLSSDQRPSLPTQVLIVEDDAPTSWRLQDALAKAGFAVRAGRDSGRGPCLPGPGPPESP